MRVLTGKPLGSAGWLPPVVPAPTAISAGVIGRARWAVDGIDGAIRTDRVGDTTGKCAANDRREQELTREAGEMTGHTDELHER